MTARSRERRSSGPPSAAPVRCCRQGRKTQCCPRKLLSEAKTTPPARTSSATSGSTVAAGRPGSGTPGQSSAARSGTPKERSALHGPGWSLGTNLLRAVGVSSSLASAGSRQPEPLCESTTACSSLCSPLGSCSAASLRTSAASPRGLSVASRGRAQAPATRPCTTAPRAPSSGAPKPSPLEAGSSATTPLAASRAANASTNGEAKATAGHRRIWKTAAAASAWKPSSSAPCSCPSTAWPAGAASLASGGSTISSGCTNGSWHPRTMRRGTTRRGQLTTEPSSPTSRCTLPPVSELKPCW
mmetsp:Transcript_18072/g.52638  ORF Transcript_18072/g.52638 Transcript_18072/m.52638 type:complete len:300 (-) Transcript_18072:316-1215(-)